MKIIEFAEKEIKSVEPYEAKIGDCTVSIVDFVATGKKWAVDGSIINRLSDFWLFFKNVTRGGTNARGVGREQRSNLRGGWMSKLCVE